MRALLTSSEFKILNAFDFPTACEAIKAHLIERLLSPLILLIVQLNLLILLEIETEFNILVNLF